MKIVDWFKNLLNKITKKDHMLNEANQPDTNKQSPNFVQKVNVKPLEEAQTRENILRSMQNDIIPEGLSEEYNYNKFSEEQIRQKYDKESLLSENDLTALGCLYGAIKSGNNTEFPDFDKNYISKFIKASPNNIVTLVNLMIKDAERCYQSLDEDSAKRTTVKGLIPGSYIDISGIIANYNLEQQESREEI